jgi:EAL domain-containing protein (putative c-di-GMP-specific phosphodiesterase class I)
MLENSVVQAESGPQERIAVALEDLWHAIEEDQFLPHFQPKVNLLGMELAGVEALMRWRHPQHGLLTAGTFLPLIADNFLFDELSVIVLEKSVAACRAWQGLGINVPVSVNLSPDLLRDPGLTARLEEKVRAHGLPADRLIIEISEAGIAHEASDALDNLVHLRAAGFGLSIDDFGTGHIELDQLARIPANELKIDRKMLAGAARRPALRAAGAGRADCARAELHRRSRRGGDARGMGPGERARLRHGARLLHRPSDAGSRAGHVGGGVGGGSVCIGTGSRP